MAEPIGAARVELSANAAQFEKDMGRARKAVGRNAKGMRSDIGKFQTGIVNAAKSLFSLKAAALAAGGVVGLAFLVKRAIETADAIAKTADKVGVGVEALQEYQFAAEIAGVNSQTLNMALQRLSRRVGEAAQGEGELKATLDQYGIAATDAEGRTRSVESVLDDLADTIQQADSDTERLRIAFKAFDSEGAALVNMLRDGSVGLEKMRQEARDMGIVLDEVMIRDAEEANDQLTRMGTILSRNLTRALLTLTPQIIALGDAFIEHIQPFTEWLTETLPAASAPAKELERRIGSLRAELASLGEESENTAQTGMFSVEGDTQKNIRIQQLRSEIAELEKFLTERQRKEAMLRASISGAGPGGATKGDQKRTMAVDKQLTALEAQAEQERLIGTEKKIAAEITKAQNALLDEQGNMTRQLTEAELQRITMAVQRGDAAKQEVDLARHLAEQERANLEAVTELGIQGEVRKAQLIAQSLLMDEQGRLTRELTEAEKQRIASTVVERATTEGNVALKRHILDLEKQTRDQVVGIGVDAEVRRAIIEAQNLLLDEQGNKIRELSDLEKGRIEAAVRQTAKVKQMNDTFAELSKVGERAFDRIGEAVTKMVVEGKSDAIEFGNIWKGILSELVQEFIKLSLLNPLKNAIFGTALPVFGGGRASGGPVSAGTGYVVGERGPEFFVPRQSGTIIPAAQASREGATMMGGDVQVNVYAPEGSSVEQRESSTANGGRQIDIIIDEVVARNISTPGSRTARAMGTRFAGLNPALQGR